MWYSILAKYRGSLVATFVAQKDYRIDKPERAEAMLLWGLVKEVQRMIKVGIPHDESR